MKVDARLICNVFKIDEQKREVWGRGTSSAVDKVNEICDYKAMKPLIMAWSQEFADASKALGENQFSLGNIREMHGAKAAGKVIALDFDDSSESVIIGSKIVDDDAWTKCWEGVYTGFSVGGKYVGPKVKQLDGTLKVIIKPAEFSVVDNPCNADCHFDVVKMDGSTEVKKFAAIAAEETPMKPEDIEEAAKVGAKHSQATMDAANACKAALDSQGQHFNKTCACKGVGECMNAIVGHHADATDAMKYFGAAAADAAEPDADDAKPGKTVEPEVQKDLGAKPGETGDEPMNAEEATKLDLAATESSAAVKRAEELAVELKTLNEGLDARITAAVKAAFDTTTKATGAVVNDAVKTISHDETANKPLDAAVKRDEAAVEIDAKDPNAVTKSILSKPMSLRNFRK